MRLHLANIYKPALDIPLNLDIVIDIIDIEPFKQAIIKGIWIEE